MPDQFPLSEPRRRNPCSFSLAGQHFAQKEGNFCEPSSAAGFVVIRDLLKAGIMKPNEVIVNVITSSGLKDLSTASKWMPPVPSIQPDIDEFRKTYEEYYGRVL